MVSQGGRTREFYRSAQSWRRYYNGVGVDQDYEEAVKWFRKAAKQGNGNAQCNLGDAYVDGEGVDQNHKEAIRWFQEAAKQGDVDAKQRIHVLLEVIEKK